MNFKKLFAILTIAAFTFGVTSCKKEEPKEEPKTEQAAPAPDQQAQPAQEQPAPAPQTEQPAPADQQKPAQ